MGRNNRNYKTIDTAEYVSNHREVVQTYVNKLCDMITYRLGTTEELQQFKDELRKRAYNHDMDKLTKYRVLELYASRDEYEVEEQKTEYREYHKLGIDHHPEYFINKGIDMSIVDFIEFTADIYSSNTIRKKPANSELDEEMEVAKFSKDVYNAILVTYSKMNYNYKRDVMKLLGDNSVNGLDIVDLVREAIVFKKRVKFMNGGVK